MLPIYTSGLVIAVKTERAAGEVHLVLHLGAFCEFTQTLRLRTLSAHELEPCGLEQLEHCPAGQRTPEEHQRKSNDVAGHVYSVVHTGRLPNPGQDLEILSP